jgi:P-type Cu+ transporter
LTERKVILSDWEKRAAYLAESGKTTLFVAEEGRVIGLIAVSDRLKPGSAEAIRQMQEMGLDVIMLTGDRKEVAEAFRKQLGLRSVMAEVLPADKEQKIAALQASGKKVMMVGDGINDAPALARANVGVAIGAGADIAIETADIILMRSDLNDVLSAIRLSRAVLRNIRQNLFWAFFYNVLAIPLAAGVFYPLFGWTLNPMVAAAAMSFSSVTVVLNALRLRRFKLTNSPNLEPVLTAGPSVIELNTIKQDNNMITKVLHIEGMSCMHCVSRVENALNDLPGVEAHVDLANKTATLTLQNETSDEILKKAVEAAGYEVVGID